MRIVIVGLPQVGKSAVGKALALKANLPFVELDKKICDRCPGLDHPSDISKRFGLCYFRKLETEALECCNGLQSGVISTGGGIVLSDKNRVLIKEIGTVVYLRGDNTIVKDRLRNKSPKPTYLNHDQWENSVEALFDERIPLYTEVADIVIDVGSSSPEECADQILEKCALPCG